MKTFLILFILCLCCFIWWLSKKQVDNYFERRRSLSADKIFQKEKDLKRVRKIYRRNLDAEAKFLDNEKQKLEK